MACAQQLPQEVGHHQTYEADQAGYRNRSANAQCHQQNHAAFDPVCRITQMPCDRLAQQKSVKWSGQ